MAYGWNYYFDIGEHMEEIRVQVKFSEVTAVGTCNDALYFTLDGYSALSKAEVDKMKQNKIDAWALQVSPPLDELKKQENALILKIAEWQAEVDRGKVKLAEIQKLIAQKV